MSCHTPGSIQCRTPGSRPCRVILQVPDHVVSYSRFQTMSYSRFQTMSYSRFQTMSYTRFQTMSYSRFQTMSYSRFQTMSYSRFHDDFHHYNFNSNYASSFLWWDCWLLGTDKQWREFCANGGVKNKTTVCFFYKGGRCPRLIRNHVAMASSQETGKLFSHSVNFFFVLSNIY